MQLILENRQFRLLWLSNAFREIALGMYVMVHGWLALTVTDSPFWVGATAGISGIGLMSFAAFGGVLVDRVDRRKIIVTGNLVKAAVLLALSVVILRGQVQLWQILAMAYFHGVATGLNFPATQALALDLVGRGKLLAAIAANHSAQSILGIIVPIAAGALVSTFEIGWAYVIMGVASLFAATAAFLMRSVPHVGEPRGSPWQDLIQGVRYVFTTPIIRGLIFLILVGEVFGVGHEVMLPVMARDVLTVGPSGLGYLMSAGMAGATVSALILASIGDIKSRGRLIVVGYAGFGVFLLLFSASRWFPLSMLSLALGWGFWMTYETTIGTVIQTVVPNEMRGRVLSAQTFTWGTNGFSGFHTGAIATLLGAPSAIAIGAGILLLNALRVVRRVSRFDAPTEELTADE